MQKDPIYIDTLNLTENNNRFKATLCCCYFRNSINYEKLIHCLHTQEREYYNTLNFEKRIRSYLLGRFVAKKAIAVLNPERSLRNIFIQNGVFNQPIVSVPNIQVSITHCDNFAAALAFPETHPMGIDIEKVNCEMNDVLEKQMTKSEKKLLTNWPFSYTTGLTILWTAKEALSKVLKTGLMTPFEIFEISENNIQDNYLRCYYKNFAQYQVFSFPLNDYVCSIVEPLKTKAHFDIDSLRKKFVNQKN